MEKNEDSTCNAIEYNKDMNTNSITKWKSKVYQLRVLCFADFGWNEEMESGRSGRKLKQEGSAYINWSLVWSGSTSAQLVSNKVNLFPNKTEPAKPGIVYGRAAPVE